MVPHQAITQNCCCTICRYACQGFQISLTVLIFLKYCLSIDSSHNQVIDACFADFSGLARHGSPSFGFCFDLNHALQSAIFYKKDFKEFLSLFEELNPEHYHLCGHNLEENKTHISLVESDFDLISYLDLIKEDAEVTLEVRIDKESVERDLEFVRENRVKD